MELLRAGLISALGYDLALAARPGDFYTFDTLLEHLTQLERNEQRYRGHDRAHHAPDSVTYSQRPGRSELDRLSLSGLLAKLQLEKFCWPSAPC